MAESLDSLAEFLKTAQLECESKLPMMSLLINEEGHSVELILDNKANYYGEWIEGEGGDICLYRDQGTDKVVGCHLPLYHKELVVHRIEKGVE